MTARQLHVSSGTRVQTLAASEGNAGDLTILSTFGANDNQRSVEIHIPAAARAWLARMVLASSPVPIVPAIEAIREEAERDG